MSWRPPGFADSSRATPSLRQQNRLPNLPTLSSFSGLTSLTNEHFPDCNKKVHSLAYIFINPWRAYAAMRKTGICWGKSALRTTLSFRTSPPTGVGISIDFRALYRHPFVGDGFPVPWNLKTRMGWDGKPVPYDAVRLAQQIPNFPNCRTGLVSVFPK